MEQSCSTTAVLRDEVMNGRTVVTASGTMTCNNATEIQLETCLEWEENGAFTTVKCQSTRQTTIKKFTVEAATGCLGTKKFRARVVSGGVFGQEVFSTEQSVTCM